MSPNETRSAILDAAQDLIRHRGTHAVSYQVVSDVVGIDTASVHDHFPSKTSLIEALLERYNSGFLTAVDGIRAGDTTGRVKLKAFIGLFESALCDPDPSRVCLCGILAAEIESHGDVVAQQIRDFYRTNAAHLAALLQEGRDDGTLAFDGEPSALAELVFSLLEGAMLTARADGGVPQFRRISQQLLRLVVA